VSKQEAHAEGPCPGVLVLAVDGDAVLARDRQQPLGQGLDVGLGAEAGVGDDGQRLADEILGGLLQRRREIVKEPRPVSGRQEPHDAVLSRGGELHGQLVGADKASRHEVVSNHAVRLGGQLVRRHEVEKGALLALEHRQCRDEPKAWLALEPDRQPMTPYVPGDLEDGRAVRAGQSRGPHLTMVTVGVFIDYGLDHHLGEGRACRFVPHLHLDDERLLVSRSHPGRRVVHTRVGMKGARMARILQSARESCARLGVSRFVGHSSTRPSGGDQIAGAPSSLTTLPTRYLPGDPMYTVHEDGSVSEAAAFPRREHERRDQKPAKHPSPPLPQWVIRAHSLLPAAAASGKHAIAGIAV